MKPKYHILISILALACLLGLAHAKKSEVIHSIRWGERPLTWDDFPLISGIPGDYHAMVYSDIQFEGDREKHSLRIYARMLPYRSGRVASAERETEQLLIHEQNHFNITEYHARLFRKEVIAIGKEKLTNEDLQSLGKKYLAKIDKMQDLYDRESEHNTLWPKQRYWELYIEGMLRETAQYAEEDIYQYQEFGGGETPWYRKVYVTLDGELLTSYPENEKNSGYGEVYKVERKKDSIIVSFYKNGKPEAGGYFEAPVSIMIYLDEQTREQHLFDETGQYFSSKTEVPISRTLSDSAGNLTRTYYDNTQNRVSKNGVFTQKGKWDSEQKSFYSSYYDEDGKPVTKEGAFHELREMNANKVTHRISYFDREGRPMRDNNFISIYEYEIDAQHNVIRAKLLDVDGKYAVYNGGYHNIYEYDNRGNMAATSTFDEKGNKVTDENGIHKYRYTYDIYDNVTDVRKFNLRDLPSNGADDFHQSVNIYDSLGRIKFAAQYHLDYVLKFSEEKVGATLYEYVGDSIIKIKNVDVFGIETDGESGVSMTKQLLNPKKEIINEELFNAEGYWAKTIDGVTSYTYKYDERGNQIERTAYDSLGKPRAWEEDIAITRWEYDDSDRMVKTAYFTGEDVLANDSQGTAYSVFKYDEDNYVSEVVYFSKDVAPSLFEGVHRSTYLENRFGRDSIVKRYDTHNQLIKDAGVVKYRYSNYGILLSEAYYDEKDRPTLDGTGIHKTVYNYDKFYRYTGVSYKGKYGEAINNYQGIAQIALELIPSGYLWKLSYFDKNQKPVLGPDGFHSLHNHYNDLDIVVRTSTYGPDQKLMDSDGIADYVFTVNSSGQIIRVSFYDAEANLAEDPEGVAEYYYEASLNGLYFLEKQLNAKGEEIPQADS